MHPVAHFFSTHHPVGALIKADFSGSAGAVVKARLEAPEVMRVRDGQALHTGYLTVVLDSIMGGAVMGILEKVQPIATVGLSISHLRRPLVGESLRATATCTGVFKDLAYVTGDVRAADGETLAIASGSFMIGTRATSIRNRTEDSRI